MLDVVGFVRRPDAWLPFAGILVATALVILGTAASQALSESHALALEGRVLHLAQQVERELRESGPEAAEDVLDQQLSDAANLVTGLALLDIAGNVQLQIGELSAAGTRDVELHLGRVWHTGALPGRRVLRIAIQPAAFGRALNERLLLPVTIFSGLVLAMLSALGGRLLARQQHEQRNAARQRRLEGLARAGAGLAHQLRTPLATIKGSCQLLLEAEAGDASSSEEERLGEKRLQAAVSQTERMETLLQQLLDYARPPHAEPAVVDLGAVTREIAEVDIQRVQPLADSSLKVWVDPEHLRAILDNLIDNALRLSDGTVELSAEAGGRSVTLRIADRGPGPGDEPESLFEPYVTRRADGTGLGLPIARALAEANGGRLKLAHRPGGGTFAVLQLPATDLTK